MKEKFLNFLHSRRGENFKNFVFGFQDGLITTYILLTGIAILVLFNPTLLLITLTAEITAGAISMMFGAYISTKTKNESLKRLNDIDDKLVNGKRIKDFSKKKGLSEDELKNIESFFEIHPNICNKLLSRQEDDTIIEDPVNNGIFMGMAFVLGGIIPIIPYLIPTPTWSFILATILSFSALFIIGLFRSFFSEKHWLIPALEMILIGILAVIIIEFYLFFISMTYGLILVA